MGYITRLIHWFPLCSGCTRSMKDMITVGGLCLRVASFPGAIQTSTLSIHSQIHSQETHFPKKKKRSPIPPTKATRTTKKRKPAREEGTRPWTKCTGSARRLRSIMLHLSNSNTTLHHPDISNTPHPSTKSHSRSRTEHRSLRTKCLNILIRCSSLRTYIHCHTCMMSVALVLIDLSILCRESQSSLEARWRNLEARVSALDCGMRYVSKAESRSG